MERITVTPARSRGTINRNLYGHFSEHLGRCVYQGLFVGKDSAIPNVNGMRTDVVQALKRLHVPVLRWPGGCFADEYHWRDGIGPLEGRRRMVNSTWGGGVEDNSFGTHEFMELCRQVGCEPYFNANAGSGTVREMAEWVEYLNCEGDSTLARERRQNGRSEPFGVRYWGVGNETWGCGGNMRAEYYADVYRRYQTFCRDYGANRLFRIASGPNEADWHWTETLMQSAASMMDGLTLHYYTVPGTWQDKGSATEFSPDAYETTLRKADRIGEIMDGHIAVMDRYDPERRVALIVDEWGCWHNVEPDTNPGYLYQQNTMRDAMVAALTLNHFNRRCDRVAMANIAQMVNVLQAVILTDGADMLLTPTYHVFEMYRPHMDAREADCYVECGRLGNGLAQLSASASVKDGELTVTLANLSADARADVLLRAPELTDGVRVEARVLSGDPHAHNTFDSPEAVAPVAFDRYAREDGGLRLALPACSLLALTVKP